MSILPQIFQWLAKVFWPWFIRNAWPVIKQHVLEVIRILLDILKDKIKDYVSKRSEQKEYEAEERVKDAENRAKSANSQQEREKWEAIAGAWQEVANTFREENEALKKRIEELTSEVMTESEDVIENTKIVADFLPHQTSLTIGNKTRVLPNVTLNMPEDDESNTTRGSNPISEIQESLRK